ncbi:hypothetical protein ScPMuIL_007316 [Solemya velum]
MSKTPAPQSTAAPKKGHSDTKTLPVPRPLSPRSGAAQKLPVPKPDSSGSGAAQRVVSGLRLRTTFSVEGELLCVGRRVVCGGGRPSVVRGDDGEVYVGSYRDRKISRVSADGAVSTFSKLTFYPRGLTQLSSGRLLVCGGEGGLYTVTGRGVQGVELGVDVKDAVDVSVNSKGDVAVADYDGRKVCILDGQYKHVGTYSPTKSGPFRPSSLTSDGENFVICDCTNRTIDTIDRRGVCLSVYPTTGDCQETPRRVDMLPSNCVWVKLMTAMSVCTTKYKNTQLTTCRHVCLHATRRITPWTDISQHGGCFLFYFHFVHQQMIVYAKLWNLKANINIDISIVEFVVFGR